MQAGQRQIDARDRDTEDADKMSQKYNRESRSDHRCTEEDARRYQQQGTVPEKAVR